MSVEISGPKGYDFQYLNSLLLALEYLDKDEVEIYIEKKNGEDAQIIFNQEGIKYIVDIQVKNRSKEIDLQSFAGWISHFENRSVKMNLLKKLGEDNNRFAVFISDARSRDDVSLFVDEGMIHSESSIRFNNEHLNIIRECIKSCYSDSSSTSSSRMNSLKEFINSIASNDLRNILKKIKLRERYTETYSTEKIRYLLNKEFYIPLGKTDELILELIDKIRNSRGTDFSISFDLLHIINNYSVKIILNRNSNYIKRTERELCERILSSTNVLLLTGISFCGKSYLAKDIAQVYLENGYNVEQVGELYHEGAISFIRHRGIEDRLLILEDPFGQVETKRDSISILNEIRNLIRECKVNRKIIITSRKDILVDVFSKKSFNECSIDSHNWVDLTIELPEKMRELWEKYYGNSEESIKTYENITRWLEKSEKTSSLQLGHISNIYHAKKDLRELTLLEPGDIISTARIDSSALSVIVERRGNVACKVFIALGLSCNTYKSVTLSDLAFILSEYKENPGMHKDKGNVEFSLYEDKDESKEVIFPRYNYEYEIKNKYKDELKYLKQHGYIEIDNLKRIMFVHPIYHYAANLLFKKQFEDIFEQQEVMPIVKQCLGSISLNANLCTLSILENFYEQNPDAMLKEHILMGLDSVFPSVRDKVIMFFDRRINDLDDEEQKRFIDVLMYGQSIKNDGVCWNDGIPYYNIAKVRRFSYCNWLQDKLSSGDINDLIKKINDGDAISSKEMWDLLNTRNSGSISLDILEKALSYDESFIRGKAIRIMFENYAYEFEKVDEYLNRHEHPEFIYSLFRGALNSWLRYSSKSKREILGYFKDSLDIMSVAIRTKKFLEYFEDEYSSESIDWSKVDENQKEVLWDVWHEVFVEFLNKFPSRYLRMNEPHMVKVANNSLEYIKAEEKIVKLATSWFNWLNRYLQYKLPQDFGMSVAKYLMHGTGNKSEHREKIFTQMLSTENTSFITYNVKVFVDYWDNLSVKEKKIVIDLLKSNRKDVKWIKAVVLNRKEIADEIQIELLGEKIDNKSITEIVSILIEKELLEQCLNIHCGYPEPLGWNGYSHNNPRLWDSVIVEVLKRNELNRSFDIALREVIDSLYNYENEKIPNILDIYEHDLLKVADKRKLIFERLLHVTATQNQCNKKLWDLLLKNSLPNEIELYFDRISEDIEIIQYQQYGYEDLFGLFDKSVVFDKIYPRLETDMQIKNIVEELFGAYKKLEQDKKIYEFSLKFDKDVSVLQDFLSEDISNKSNELEVQKTNFIETVSKIYKNNPPRLFLSNKFVSSVIEEIKINSSELESLIEKNRKRLLKISRVLEKKYDDHYELENWVG